MENVVKEKNEELKLYNHEMKEYKPYMSKISQSKVEKIGSKTLLDKQWAEKPLTVIKNPHKLSEMELH